MTIDTPSIPPEAEPFANRLRKNDRALARWAKREKICCYRLYDADLPEFALAIDRYGDYLHVQEYAPPPSIDPAKAEQRLRWAMAALPAAAAVAPTHIALKVRKRQRGREQYQKQGDRRRYLAVAEHPVKLWVNLFDYLDTGLFLDHRPIRRWIGDCAQGLRVLNLFAYTGVATLHAAVGGAAETTTVDLSNTYLDWAKRNLQLNDIAPDEARHRFIQADCGQWLQLDRGRYDLIFLDPPTFSNSKRTPNAFDIQRDHIELIHAAVARLTATGVLVFSNNFRRFKLERERLGSDLGVEEITPQTIPRDFARRPRIHQCYLIYRGQERPPWATQPLRT